VYEVIAEPPFEAGAAKLTVALRLPVAVANTEVGTLGAATTGVQPVFVLLPSPALERFVSVSKVPQYW